MSPEVDPLQLMLAAREIGEEGARRMTICSHPLAGKLVAIDDLDHAAHTVSMFIAEIGPGLMLARRLNPRTGADFAEMHIIVLAQVAQDEYTMIFDDWEACERFYSCPHDTERVVRLVPKEKAPS